MRFEKALEGEQTLTPTQNYIYIDIVENKEFSLLGVSWKLERTLDF